MRKSSSSIHTGFTLVETLVAIAILMIAIAGPLVIATKGLTSALYSKNQMIASFLAQESMEIIKNTRDNNMAAGVSGWLDSFSGCSQGAPCDASSIGPIISSGCSSTSGCPIYYDTASGFKSSASTGTQTQFSRRFYIENLASVGSVEQANAHVIVDWNEGSIPFEIHLVSTLLEVTR